MSIRFTESVVEAAALDWFHELDYTLASEPDLLPDGPCEDLGLSEDERAFYDALETNDSAVAVHYADVF